MAKAKKEEESKPGTGSQQEEEDIRTTPDVEADFSSLLKDYGLKENKADVITSFIAHTGTPQVFERPMELVQKLAQFPRDIAPVTRKTIIDHWIGEKNIPIPEGYAEEAEKPAEEIRARGGKAPTEEAKFSVDPATGNIRVVITTDKAALTWDQADILSKDIQAKLETQEKKAAQKSERKVTYVYDDESGQVRMAKADEVGGTLEQAKELKKLAEGGKKDSEADRWMMDNEGNWVPNPKTPHSFQEMMAYETIQKSRGTGQPLDPIEAMAQAGERVKLFREAMGISTDRPDWMSDPVKFFQTMQALSGGGKGDEDLKKEITQLQTAITEMREEGRQRQIDALATQNAELTRKIDALNSRLEDQDKRTTGSTEIDLLRDVATKGFEEIGHLRQDLRSFGGDVMGGTRLPRPKTPEEKEEQTARIRQAVDEDREIQELGQGIWG